MSSSDQTIGMRPLEGKITPDAFHMWASHYFKGLEDFIPPHSFSPVPYFLVCRAIELQLKAFHLETRNQRFVKTQLGHNLVDSYLSLPVADQILSTSEFDELQKANNIYNNKGFEYFRLVDAMSGYSIFPSIEILKVACKKLLCHKVFDIPQSRFPRSRLLNLVNIIRRFLLSRELRE